MTKQELASTGTVALKEWASAVEALAEGRQIILMRKGGIVEETRDFRLESPSFALYPTYEHQRAHLLKPEHRELVERTIGLGSPGGDVRLTLRAEVTDDLEVADQETLDKLRGFHIWTDDFAAERLKWKRTKPLHVLLVRAYRLPEPLDIPYSDAYGGCKSWVRLERAVSLDAGEPVLDDRNYQAARDAILQALRS